MSLNAGNKLAHYEVVEPIGSGGMGDVYLAEDTKLARQVALKVLPPELADDDERRVRFEREAKALAALDHPNIVQIFSVEQAEGIHFITMQLVRGKTLTELLPKNGFPLTEFLDLAIPFADAVVAAHQEGITHRDLKPDNLMLGDDGRTRVLDFGLAKPTSGLVARDGASELPTAIKTQDGAIVGTVAYMSPEQAEGKTVDARSDIFSMGVVLYEMVTGQRPFQGDTTAAILSSVIKDTPASVTELNPGLPQILGRTIKRCLAKDPSRRYQTAIDVRNELEELKREVDSGELSEGVRARNKPLMLIASFALVFVAGTIGYLSRSERADVPSTEGTLTQLTSQAGEELFPSLSPDGDTVIYASAASGNWDIYRRRVAGETAFNLTEDSAHDDTQPVFSPDGASIAFRSERDDGGIFLMGATGESIRRLSDFGYSPAWSPDGKEIVVATEGAPLYRGARGGASELWVVDVITGQERLLSEGDAAMPSWSPTGEWIAVQGASQGSFGTRGSQQDIWILPAAGGEPRSVTNDPSIDENPVWSADGEYLYFSSDRGGTMSLWRAAISPDLEMFGEPEIVSTAVTAAVSHLTVARQSTYAAYAARVTWYSFRRFQFDAASGNLAGEPQTIRRSTEKAHRPSASPDGEWIAFTIGQIGDVAIMRADGTSLARLTQDDHRDTFTRLSPDGRQIAFRSNRSGEGELWVMNRDGSSPRQLTDIPGTRVSHPVWSPNGRLMACDGPEGPLVFDSTQPWKEQIPRKLRLAPGHRMFPDSWSPDGMKLAGPYRRGDQPMGIAVYFLDTDDYRVVTDFGNEPRWLDDETLVFVDDEKFFLLDVESGESRTIPIEGPELWSSGEYGLSRTDAAITYGWVEAESDIWLLELK